jgi:hypothetical protein
MDALVMKKESKFTTRENEVVHNLISRAKVTCQDQKDFKKEIKNMKHDLMLNEYTQEFFDSIIKPWRRKPPGSDTVYRGRVIIPYVKGISKN